MNTTRYHHNFKSRHIVLFGVLCLFIIILQAQIRPKQLRKEVLQSQAPQKVITKKRGKPSPKTKVILEHKPIAPTVNPLSKRGVTLVYLEHSETLSFDKIMNPNMQVLKGNVRFRHDNALLYCDSAYFFDKENSFNAFGNIRIVQGDTLFVYGDKLYYDGNTKLARLRHNVRMVNRKTTLITDSLNYDRLANLAYYYTGGKITDQLNVLTSVWGQYSPSTNDVLFKNQVHLKNKNFILDSDTLKYNTKTNIANIVGPTHIVYNDETDIYSKRGWYNTATDRSMLLDRSIVKHKDGKTLIGDTIFYDKKLKYGEGFKRVVMNDTIQKSTLYGDYCYYNDITKKGLASDSAMLVDWSGKDSMFVHADTLLTLRDSIYNVARGYYHVRIFRNDIQGLCDSLTYSARDSVMNMYGEPVLWSDNNQLSGETIQTFSRNKKVDHIDIQHEAVAIQHEDSVFYNQLSGKEIIAYVDSGQLKKVKVNGNAETIYYPRDEKDSTLVGLNKTQSSFVVMYLKNKKVQRVVMTTSSNGTMYPLDKISGKDLYLKNFFWLEDQRPKVKQDIFLVFPKVKRPKPGGLESNDNPKTARSGPGGNKNVSPGNTTPAISSPNLSNPKAIRK
ncbi:MAG: OstA-like protein [Bacteroidota bacterium]|nr:OstA-like protein [Bacteroidota bacterium]